MRVSLPLLHLSTSKRLRAWSIALVALCAVSLIVGHTTEPSDYTDRYPEECAIHRVPCTEDVVPLVSTHFFAEVGYPDGDLFFYTNANRIRRCIMDDASEAIVLYCAECRSIANGLDERWGAE